MAVAEAVLLVALAPLVVLLLLEVLALIAVLFLRGLAESWLIDQKCSEQIQGVWSAKSLSMRRRSR